MRDENDNVKKENEYNDSTDDDILSLLQDSSDEPDNESNINSESYYDNSDQTSEMEDTDEDLLALLDMISAQDESNANKYEGDDFSENHVEAKRTDNAAENQSVREDILAINELAGEESVNSHEEIVAHEEIVVHEEIINHEELANAEEKSNNSNDVGDIFSDVLSAVDSLQDKEEISSDNMDPVIPEKAGIEAKDEKKSKKKGFWQKIFGKVDIQSENEAQSASLAADLKADKKKKEKIKKSKEVNKKNKKMKKSSIKNNNGKEDGRKDKKSNSKNKSAKKKSENKKKSKPLKNKAAAQTVDTVNDSDDNIKINKLAVIFVMTFFILIGGFVIIGTNLYSYSLNIKNASFDFTIKRYTEAYNDIYGLDMRKKDSEVYEKIMTVMYVNKHLNSYKNYCDMKKYPEALDSLLKGIERYDKYIAYATDLGIKSDMDYVKEQILIELKNKFNITEEEAVALNNTEEQTQYSINVINTALEKMN